MQEAERLLAAAGLRVWRAVRCHCGRAGLPALHRLGRAALTLARHVFLSSSRCMGMYWARHCSLSS